jgi:hypothetical protein
MGHFRFDNTMAVILHWADGISEEHLALSCRVCELESVGSRRSVRGLGSGSRTRRGRESPIARTIRPVLMGAGTKDVPYMLVEIEDDVPAAAGPS